VYRVFTTTAHSGRIVLCFVGFAVAMVWILLIVNEVVGVLQVGPRPKSWLSLLFVVPLR
jgi:hypothetical protein